MLSFFLSGVIKTKILKKIGILSVVLCVCAKLVYHREILNARADTVCVMCKLFTHRAALLIVNNVQIRLKLF